MMDNNTVQRDERTLEHGFEKVKITHIPDKSVVLVGGEKGGLGVMLPYKGNNRDLHNPGDTILDDLSATLL